MPAAIAATDLPVATQARHHGVSRWSVALETHKHDHVETPHGKLYTKMKVLALDGAEKEIDCISHLRLYGMLQNFHRLMRSSLLNTCQASSVGLFFTMIL